MNISVVFFLNAVLLGVGLAMDAFSVSIANALIEPRMTAGRMSRIAGVYAGFQILMPLVGWACVHTIAQKFSAFEHMIPWIALFLLLYIGLKMTIEGIREKDISHPRTASLGAAVLLLQGIATSIDALSVGFTIAKDTLPYAAATAVIIGCITFFICMGGLRLGKTIGTHFAGKASVLGGLILIGIGIEIFIRGVFFP